MLGPSRSFSDLYIQYTGLSETKLQPDIAV